MFPKRILNVDLSKAYLPKCTHIFFSKISFFYFVVSLGGDMVACSRLILKWPGYFSLDQEVLYFRERPAEGRDEKRSSVQRQQQKSNLFRLAKNNLHVHHAFLYISLPSLHDYNVEVPQANFMFCGGREHTTTTFFFLSWTLIQSFRIQIQKKFEKIWRIELGA